MSPLVVFGLAVAAMSFTVSRSSMPLVKSARQYLQKRGPFFQELLHCPYCCSHWVALGVCGVYQPRFVESRWVIPDLVLSWLAIVGASMVPVFMLLYISRQEMTERQRQRLEAAERVCALVSRDTGAGFDDRPYRPDVVTALHVMRDSVEKLEDLPPGACHTLGDLADEIDRALNAWLRLSGIDPATYAKGNAQQNFMALAKDAFGPEYEGEGEPAPAARYQWPDRTADERAASVAQEICSGRVKGFEEARIAIAGEILEAETQAREPFLTYARRIFGPIAKARGAELPGKTSDDWSKAMVEFLQSTATYLPELVQEFGEAASEFAALSNSGTTERQEGTNA